MPCFYNGNSWRCDLHPILGCDWWCLLTINLTRFGQWESLGFAHALTAKNSRQKRPGITMPFYGIREEENLLHPWVDHLFPYSNCHRHTQCFFNHQLKLIFFPKKMWGTRSPAGFIDVHVDRQGAKKGTESLRTWRRVVECVSSWFCNHGSCGYMICIGIYIYVNNIQ